MKGKLIRESCCDMHSSQLYIGFEGKGTVLAQGIGPKQVPLSMYVFVIGEHMAGATGNMLGSLALSAHGAVTLDRESAAEMAARISEYAETGQLDYSKYQD